ncbi:hypothetical protein F7725_020283 [Dissostichus mawsoni]|uniref:Uncharacterized protein n=1 Tax=Dissostichus mawsoni TaxID=36200 RepID=A0A7J5YCU7_DISMA|nr:hypothetical protein F7725_020283 [Dissostichus mawsoni]
MSEKRKGDDSSSAIKKKMRTYLESYLNLGFMEGTDKTRPECVICREKLANDSMKPCKMKRHQQTMHPETVGQALDAFVRKLEYRVGKMERGELQQFPLLLKQSRNNPETVSVRREFIRHMNALQKEMKSRFADIDEYVSKELWVLDPFIAKVEDVEYLDCEDELTDIQADSLSKKYFQEKGFKKFWIVKGPSLAPKLTLHATTRIILPFSTTYLSETAFSALVAIKTKARNTLDVHNDFRLAVTHITPDIPSLAAGMQAQAAIKVSKLGGGGVRKFQQESFGGALGEKGWEP